MLALALLLVAAAPEARVVLELATAEELSPGDAASLLRGLASAIEARTGYLAGVEPDPAVRERVKVELYGGLTVIRVVAERRAFRAELDVGTDRDTWTEPLESLARSLFPDGTWTSVQVEPVPVPAPPIVEERTAIGPWIAVGAGVVFGSLFAGFGRSSASARDQSQDSTLSEAEFDALADRTQAHAIAADIFLLGALGAIATGVVLWAVE